MVCVPTSAIVVFERRTVRSVPNVISLFDTSVVIPVEPANVSVSPEFTTSVFEPSEIVKELDALTVLIAITRPLAATVTTGTDVEPVVTLPYVPATRPGTAFSEAFRTILPVPSNDSADAVISPPEMEKSRAVSSAVVVFALPYKRP